MLVQRIAATAAALALGVSGLASASPARHTVKGAVGPGFEIRLAVAGSKVATLRPGVPYRFVIDDSSSMHDFHLRGPGLDRTITGVAFTGTKAVTLTLRRGTYRYFCALHAGFMSDTFKVA